MIWAILIGKALINTTTPTAPVAHAAKTLGTSQGTSPILHLSAAFFSFEWVCNDHGEALQPQNNI